MKLGANPESGLMQLPMLNPVLHPSQRSASVKERGVAPCIEFKGWRYKRLYKFLVY